MARHRSGSMFRYFRIYRSLLLPRFYQEISSQKTRTAGHFQISRKFSAPQAPGQHQRKEKQRVSGTSNEVSAKPNPREPVLRDGTRPARAGKRFPIPVGTYSEYPRFKRTCTHVQVRAQRLFFWTVHCAAVGGCAAYGCGIPPAGAARFLFGKTKRKWGVDCQAINIAYIHPIGRPPASHGGQKNQFSTYETENFTDPNPGVIQKRSEPIWRLESIIPPRSGG